MKRNKTALLEINKLKTWIKRRQNKNNSCSKEYLTGFYQKLLFEDNDVEILELLTKKNKAYAAWLADSKSDYKREHFADLRKTIQTPAENPELPVEEEGGWSATIVRQTRQPEFLRRSEGSVRLKMCIRIASKNCRWLTADKWWRSNSQPMERTSRMRRLTVLPLLNQEPLVVRWLFTSSRSCSRTVYSKPQLFTDCLQQGAVVHILFTVAVVHGLFTASCSWSRTVYSRPQMFTDCLQQAAVVHGLFTASCSCSRIVYSRPQMFTDCLQQAGVVYGLFTASRSCTRTVYSWRSCLWTAQTT